MKSISFSLIITAFFWINIPTYVQGQIISLTEERNSGKKGRLLGEISTGKKSIKIPADQTGIVDVNSNISLKLRLDLIENEMLKFQGVLDEDIRQVKLEKLNTLLEKEIAITNYLNSGFKINSATHEGQLIYFEGLYKIQNQLLRDLRSTDHDLYIELIGEEAWKAFRNFEGSFLEFVYFFVNQKADDLRNEILASLGPSEEDSTFQVFFRLGAFIRNKDGGRPIHIENFDTYDQERYQEVGRFVSPISQEVQNAIRANAKLNSQLEGEISQTANYFKGVISGYEKELLSFKRQFDDFQSIYRSNMERLQESPNTLPAADLLMDNSIGLNHVEALYSTLFSRYNDFARLFSPDKVQNEKLDETLIILENTILAGYNTFDYALQKYFHSQQVSAKKDLGFVKQEYKNYVDAARKHIIDINTLVQKVRYSIQLFRKAYLENKEFSNKVIRSGRGRGDGKIPRTGLIELNYIGTIQPGDEILIKASLERGTNIDDQNFQERQILRQVIKVQRIKPYIRMSGSIIMANPYTRDKIDAITFKNSFQLAPSFGIMLKRGSRKSMFYNQFINFGFGFAFSSQDFNTDGTPEFGAGMMLTGFRDILSAGWGWNFGVDAPYTFIGFNIPFGGFLSAN